MIVAHCLIVAHVVVMAITIMIVVAHIAMIAMHVKYAKKMIDSAIKICIMVTY